MLMLDFLFDRSKKSPMLAINNHINRKIEG